MNCATHSNVAAVAYCRTCGKPLCANCVRDVRGTIFCEPCLAERLAGALPPPPVTPPNRIAAAATALPERLPSPGLAAALGFIPGVGAMYNGQFMKGFIHVGAFVCLIWMASRFGPIMIPVFFAYFFYLVFDAYKTAHAIELGLPLPDPLGFERMFGPTVHPGTQATTATGTAASNLPLDKGRYRKSVPTGAVVLIGLGVLFLLHTAGLFSFDIGRFSPLILVLLGLWLLARRWGMFGPTGARCECDRCRMNCIMWPVILITVGVLFLLDNLDAVSFGRTWPAIILAIGVVKLLQSNASSAGHIDPQLPSAPPSGTVPAQDLPSGQSPSSEVNHV
jgi:TM2 domain-containing membrane protein YozV